MFGSVASWDFAEKPRFAENRLALQSAEKSCGNRLESQFLLDISCKTADLCSFFAQMRIYPKFVRARRENGLILPI
jgi:hypothetical protein